MEETEHNEEYFDAEEDDDNEIVEYNNFDEDSEDELI